jgi:hypothetical protein
MNWAARAGVALDSNKIGIYVTDQPVKNMTPKDYTLQY